MNTAASFNSIPRSAFRVPRSHERGGMLVITIIFCALVGLVLTAYLSMLKTQHRFTHRSAVWNDCIPLCEAGIEEAMGHLNYSGTTSNFAINGWVLSSGFYRKQVNLNGGFVQIAIDTAMPPTITVNGFLRAPLSSSNLTRSIRLRTKLNQRFPHAILGKSTIVCNSAGARVDSFDSTDPTKSTGGQYDPLKAQDDATIATTAKTAGAIDIGNLSLYGKAGTGPGGTVSINNGNVGSTDFNNNPSNDGKIEAGHFSDDVNMYIPDPTLPSPFGNNIPLLSGLIGLITHTYVLNSGDYRMASLNLGSSQDLYVTGNARLYITGGSRIDGAIVLAPGASLEIYTAGNMDISSGYVNNPGLAKDFSIIGLNTCTDIKYNGGAKFIGTVYAPRAAVTITGSAGVTGALVANTIKLTGGMNFHYDESLKGDPRQGRFVAASYQEL